MDKWGAIFLCVVTISVATVACVGIVFSEAHVNCVKEK